MYNNPSVPEWQLSSMSSLVKWEGTRALIQYNDIILRKIPCNRHTAGQCIIVHRFPNDNCPLWVPWWNAKVPGPWFNISRSSYQYRKSHWRDKMVERSSYLHNGIFFTGKMASLYWISPLYITCVESAIWPGVSRWPSRSVTSPYPYGEVQLSMRHGPACQWTCCENMK